MQRPEWLRCCEKELFVWWIYGYNWGMRKEHEPKSIPYRFINRSITWSYGNGFILIIFFVVIWWGRRGERGTRFVSRSRTDRVGKYCLSGVINSIINPCTRLIPTWDLAFLIYWRDFSFILLLCTPNLWGDSTGFRFITFGWTVGVSWPFIKVEEFYCHR